MYLLCSKYFNSGTHIQRLETVLNSALLSIAGCCEAVEIIFMFPFALTQSRDKPKTNLSCFNGKSKKATVILAHLSSIFSDLI